MANAPTVAPEARGEGRSNPARTQIAPTARPGAAQRLVDRSFAALSVSAAAREAHREAMQRGAALLRRSRALCAQPAEPLWPLPLPPAEKRAVALPRPALRLVRTCGHVGCENVALYRPTFLIGLDPHHLVHLKDVPLRVCAHHRDALAALFREGGGVDRLRQFLRARGAEEPSTVSVVFQMIN
jgi:hypothetical protein